MNFIKSDSTDTINNFRIQLYERLASPVDAMWEKLYIASSQHYLIQIDEKNIGYCCIDDDDSLTQIFLTDANLYLMQNTIKTLIESKLIDTASLSSNEPISFNACLLYSKSIKPNTFCFQHSGLVPEYSSTLDLMIASIDDVPLIKVFLKNQIGFDDNFGYTENLVMRKEMYVCKKSCKILATSELRVSGSQNDIADLGVIVNKQERGKGIASQILRQQANKAKEVGRKPICSTTVDNPASKKAIENAGFYCSSIIFNIEFYD
ncbi:GNAT family N-acetyltransferase [Aquimarina sediminis]|uniref:GNAT family N-acetyltransferase n=1 Tax=Aquimarina sediminis TaxID=2070536 RepID=UPI000CA079CE|nr:GNAT family N-acetyltransferase [Aquimarina sediminis]